MEANYDTTTRTVFSELYCHKAGGEHRWSLGISWFSAFVIKCLIGILVKDINKYMVCLKF